MKVNKAPFVEIGPWRLMWQPWQPRRRDWLAVGRVFAYTEHEFGLRDGRLTFRPASKAWRVVPVLHLLRHPVDAWQWLHGAWMA